MRHICQCYPAAASGSSFAALLEQQARRARRARQRQDVEHVADRARLAARDAELVAAPHADQQIPAPFERERAARHEHVERLEALAEAMAEIDVVLERRARRLLDRDQAVREQQVREHAGLERPLRRAHERPDARRRSSSLPADRLLAVLEIAGVDLADPVVVQAREIPYRPGPSLVPDHPNRQDRTSLVHPDNGRQSPSWSPFPVIRPHTRLYPTKAISGHLRPYMAKTPEKGRTAMQHPGALDQLQQVHELNRAFWASAVEGAGASVMLRATSVSPLSAGVGRQPAARGRRRFPAGTVSGRRRRAPRASRRRRASSMRRSTTCAFRSCSRRGRRAVKAPIKRACCSVSRAPTSSGSARRPSPSCSSSPPRPASVQCAFGERHWFWQRLFTATRPELRRQLTLMALQPGVARWPQRRPPHPTPDGASLPRRVAALTIAALGARAPHGQSWTR